MSDQIIVAIIGLVGIIFTSGLTAIMIFVKKDVKEIHLLLNSQRDILLESIKNLEERLRLSEDKNDKKDNG